MLARLLTQRLRHCSFCLRGTYVDSPYAISLRKLTRLRVSLTQASYDTTPSTHIKGGFGRRSIVVSVFEVFLFLRYSCRLAFTRFQLCPIALIAWHRNASAPMGGHHECGRPLDCLILKSMMRLNYWLETAGLTSQ